MDLRLPKACFRIWDAGGNCESSIVNKKSKYMHKNGHYMTLGDESGANGKLMFVASHRRYYRLKWSILNSGPY